MRNVLILFVVVAVIGASAQQQLTIPELVARGDGPIYIPRNRELVDVPLAEIASRASVIVEGTVAPLTSYLSRDGLWVYTDYAVNVMQVLYDRRPAAKTPGARGIVVKVFGGTITLLGTKVQVVDEDASQWSSGSHLILFLTESGTDVGKYEVVFDIAGAFAVTDKGMTPWIKAPGVLSQFRGMSKPLFLDEVRREIAK